MDLHNGTARDTLWSRLQELRQAGTGISARALRPPSIIAAARMVLGLYPGLFKTDMQKRDSELRAFVTTVIPGADPRAQNLVTMYIDPHYPFFPYSGYLVFDMARRSRKLFGAPAFRTLDQEQRTRVVEDALAADDTTARLYRGAILMAKVSYYAAIYNPDQGCPLIDFPGTNRGYSRNVIGRPDPEQYLGQAVTADGNPP